MSAAVSRPRRSNIGWKITTIVFIILTIGASSLAYYYYGQSRNGASAAASSNSYYSQWQADENKISSLNQQVSSDQSQIQSLNTEIVQLQSGAYGPNCKPSCDSTIANLHSQIDGLNSQISSDQTKISSLNSQIDDLKATLGLSKQLQLANGVTKNWAACGGTGQPSCNGVNTIVSPSWTTATVYSGYLSVTWSSTIALQVNVQIPGFVPLQTSSSSSATVLIPVSATSAPFDIGTTTLYWQIPTGTDPATTCQVGLFGNHVCPGGTNTYSITYYY